MVGTSTKSQCGYHPPEEGRGRGGRGGRGIKAKGYGHRSLAARHNPFKTDSSVEGNGVSQTPPYPHTNARQTKTHTHDTHTKHTHYYCRTSISLLQQQPANKAKIEAPNNGNRGAAEEKAVKSRAHSSRVFLTWAGGRSSPSKASS